MTVYHIPKIIVTTKQSDPKASTPVQGWATVWGSSRIWSAESGHRPWMAQTQQTLYNPCSFLTGGNQVRFCMWYYLTRVDIPVYRTKLTSTFLKTADGNFRDQSRVTILYHRQSVFHCQAGESCLTGVLHELRTSTAEPTRIILQKSLPE